MHHNALAAKGIANNVVQHKDHSVAARLLKMGSAWKGVTEVHSAGEV